MFIKKGTKLRIKFVRKGVFEATAYRDFDTVIEQIYPVITQTDIFDCFVTDCAGGDVIRLHKRFVRSMKVMT
jgi:hypothetical protein